ncbi:hypothetical protein L1277_002193 [Okibacterium sp. HSC-33S16]|uniref:hypothetical protein n=1 Tax=Okibacterium sp. HSC-33S16 TaxID=2910965 RepID=UPI0020A1BACE|nr:hypothetical protein [Okibacterium sp. HSC-33S16]MCP2032094.1 hypothetical protein [Okibacterium sp. HSC-33S16]
MIDSRVRCVRGSVASAGLIVLMSVAVLTGCSAPADAGSGGSAGATAAPAANLTADGLLADLAEIECAAYESGVYDQNEIWGEYATIAGRYEASGLIDETTVEVPGGGGTIQSISLRSVLTSEDELRDYAAVGEGVTTRRDEVGQDEYDLQTSLFCTVFSHGGAIPDDFAQANGLVR